MPFYKETSAVRLAKEQIGRKSISEILFMGTKVTKFLDRNLYSENDSNCKFLDEH